MQAKRNIGQEIKELSEAGYSYGEIRKKLDCWDSTLCYHLVPGYKEKRMLSQQKRRYSKKSCITAKIALFRRPTKKNSKKKPHHQTTSLKLIKLKLIEFIGKGTKLKDCPFTAEDVIKKFGEKPTCYLTGKEIDIYMPRTYHFDHIIPRSRGGDNSLDNLGIVSSEANKAKHNMTPDEFFNLCKQILTHQGYNVTKD